jgi:phosphatidylserine/phosphatidylglycerophosphate/cardiolipin synthase-like enzyme
VSPVTQRKRQSRIFDLEPGRNCWRIARANRASLVVDACDYFRFAREAMLKARSHILLMGWDVDTRIELVHGEEAKGEEAPVTLGALVSWIAKRRPDLQIYILAWDGEAHRYAGRGTTLLRLWRWAARRNIHFKLDHSHPREASHHQKMLVVDDRIAFCGGIDMTASRWDTRDHSDDHSGRRRPTTGRAYGPWHDAIMAVDGGAAFNLGELARLRWLCATGVKLPLASPAPELDYWPDALEPGFRDVDVAIARTRGRHKTWREVREIEALFVDLIATARRYVYIETQYFASRVVAQAIADRLGEPDGPEFVLINPKEGYGWLDEAVMGAARAELLRVLETKDRYGRFKIYTPATEGGADIYVHAKIMIVDDVALRVGSANLNNRSMGLDSECDLLIDCRLAPNEDCQGAIEAARADLLAEHLGSEADTIRKKVRETGSLIRTIEALRGEGRTLLPFVPPDVGAFRKAVAKSEVADPESADEPFEPLARHRLLSGLRRR